MPDAFNARAIFTWKPDRLYRVYGSSNQLYFIRIGGQAFPTAQVLEHQLGLVGRYLARSLGARAQEKLRRTVEEADRAGPEVRVYVDKHNLRVSREEVVESRILPPGAMASHGVRLGRWTLALRSGQRLTLQLESLDDMRSAIELLPKWLGDRLAVRVAWDEARGAYREATPPTKGRAH